MGTISYSVLIIWMIIAVASLILALNGDSFIEKIVRWFAVLTLSLIAIGIIITNSIGVTILSAVLYTYIFLKSKSID